MNRWALKMRSQLLLNFFPGIDVPNGHELEITGQMAEENLTYFAEYAHLIFKCLSNLCGYPCNTYPSAN